MAIPKNHKHFSHSVNVCSSLDLSELVTEERKAAWIKEALDDYRKHSRSEINPEDIKDIKVSLNHYCEHERAWDQYDSCDYYCRISFDISGYLPMTDKEIEAEKIRKAKQAEADKKYKEREAKRIEKVKQSNAVRELRLLKQIAKKNPELLKQALKDANA